MEALKLREDGLLLRPWRDEDAVQLHRACQDPEIGRWLPLPSPYRPADATEYVARSTRSLADGTAYHLGVFAPGSGELLGAVALGEVDPVGHEARIGYWTAPWARRRGVAVRAARALARWGFTDLGLERIAWRSQLGNHASRLVALRVGVRVEGVQRKILRHPRSGRRVDAWVGSLLPDDLDGDGSVAPPGSVAARRAALFAGEQPVLLATTPYGQLRLRAPEERDIDAITVACRDPQTRRWTTVPDPYRREDAEFFVGPYAGGRWARGDGAVFTIADESDRWVGSMELRLSTVDPMVASVGFMVTPAARGRGYAPAALTTTCAWGFAALGLDRIEWWANVGNTASRRVAEKAGFRMEGTARAGLAHRGERVDGWFGALLPADLLPRSSP